MHTMIERLIECRKAAGLSQTELAEKLGLSRQAISKWETGTVIPAAENLSALAKLYNVSLDWLVNGEGNARPQTKDEAALAAEKTTQTNKPPKSINGWRIAALVLAALLLVVVIFEIMRFQRTADATSVTHVEQVENPENGGFDIIW